MRQFLAALAASLALSVFAGSAVAQQAVTVVTTENVRAELLSEVAQGKAGEPFWVALRQTIRPKWHTYWKNPGDSGLPTEIAWTLPEGVTAGPIVWPRPSLYDIGGIVNYGFQDEAVLLVQVTPSATLSGSLPLVAEANWLVCEDVCIPEEARLELVLPVGKLAITQFLGPRPLLGTIGECFRIDYHGRAVDCIPLPHPSGASPWHRMEPEIGRAHV